MNVMNSRILYNKMILFKLINKYVTFIIKIKWFYSKLINKYLTFIIKI